MCSWPGSRHASCSFALLVDGGLDRRIFRNDFYDEISLGDAITGNIWYQPVHCRLPLAIGVDAFLVVLCRPLDGRCNVLDFAVLQGDDGSLPWHRQQQYRRP